MKSPTERILTIPNAISIVRLCCIPVFVALLFPLGRPIAAAILLAILGVTDWVDGTIARRFHQVTRFGRFVDPMADRLLMATAAISLLVIGALPIGLGLLALLREIVILLGGVYLITRGIVGLDVTWAGKCGASALMISLPLFLLTHALDHPSTSLVVLAWTSGILGVALNWYTIAQYVGIARRILDKDTTLRDKVTP